MLYERYKKLTWYVSLGEPFGWLSIHTGHMSIGFRRAWILCASSNVGHLRRYDHIGHRGISSLLSVHF